ncbi:MAG TPA: UbiX family flavin prenyltransferase [Dongiaceae bacterium]|jgi:4-hydroxy-3-polyprenylbenzoate decarboxylase|nr:UbiX family flavin prenyltransferase [Dongiaceae bacterium]
MRKIKKKKSNDLPLIVGISGASGSIYGLRLIDMLAELGIAVEAVITRTGKITIAHETDVKLAALARKVRLHDELDMTAPIASGSYPTRGMIVAPCSVKSLAEIAHGMPQTLLTRAADVTLKEQRRLVLMVRETPLHMGHLRNMLAAAEMGAIIAPPVPAFYNRPQTLAEMVEYGLGRVLDLFDIEVEGLKRWKAAPARALR